MIDTAAKDNINMAVARPFVSKIACRKGTMINKAIKAMRFNLPDCATDKDFLLEKPICLGNNELTPIGHTFLHTPTAKTISTGATGIRIFQNK